MDEEFRHPRLAALYDVLDPDRDDLDAYLVLAGELGARAVVDIGCGTGVLALLLAARGCDVVGVDPALASLDVARAKPGAHRVRWVHGDATALTGTRADLALMTANTAQAIHDPQLWTTTLRAVHDCLRPGGHLALESRDPADRAWERWTEEGSRTTAEVPGEGRVTRWAEVLDLALPLVTLRWTYRFTSGGAELTSTSTLRFRDRAELEDDLRAGGFAVVDVRGAPDRPGRELVVLARRR